MKGFAALWGENAPSVLGKAAGYKDQLLGQASVLAASAQSAVQNAVDTVQQEYQQTFVELDLKLLRVRENLIAIEFVAGDRSARMNARLNQEFAQRMLVYNMSEKTYDTEELRGEVVDVAFRGLPSPPLELLVELCVSAHQWLDSDPAHVLIVHCFSGFSRSAVFLSAYLAWTGVYPNPSDALQEVCKKLQIEAERVILPSQKRYLGYFQQCQQGFSPKEVPLGLTRVTLNGIPVFEMDQVVFRPYIEVWQKGTLAYTSLPSGADKENGPEVPGFYKGDTCASFEVPGIVLSGDVLLRVRHFSSKEQRETALRFAFHTAFVPDGLQLSKKELDGACVDPRCPEDFFIDLVFENDALVTESSDATSDIYARAREISQGLRDKRQQEASSAGVQEESGPDPEEALMRQLGLGAEAEAAPDPAPQPKAAAPSAEEKPKPAPAASSSSPPKAEKKADPPAPSKDIDDIFGDLDLELSAPAPAAKVAPAAKAASPVPASTQPDKPPAAAPAAAPQKAAPEADGFGDVDDFLAELDSLGTVPPKK